MPWTRTYIKLKGDAAQILVERLHYLIAGADFYDFHTSFFLVRPHLIKIRVPFHTLLQLSCLYGAITSY